MTDSPYYNLGLAIKRGLINGHEGDRKFGHSDTIDTSWVELLDLSTATRYNYRGSATAMTVSSASTDDVTSLGTLTFALNVGNTETITIGTKVYTFQTSLTNVDGNVKIGGSASASIDNLIAAINLAAGAGSTYAASMTAADDDIVAIIGAGDTMILFVLTAGAIDTTASDGNTTWGAANAVLGVGAWSVQIWGLDANWNPVTEVVYLRGRLGVTTDNSYIRIYRLKVITAGTDGFNNGNIHIGTGTITTGVPAVIHGAISFLNALGFNQSLMAIYPVKLGYKGYITQWGLRGDNANKAVEGALFVREFGEVHAVKDTIELLQTPAIVPIDPPIECGSKSDISIMARSASSGTQMSGFFSVIMIDQSRI